MSEKILCIFVCSEFVIGFGFTLWFAMKKIVFRKEVRDMASEGETVAEILSMMRDACNLDPSAIEDNNHLLSDWFYDDECQGWLSSYADRIEAAHRREVEELTAIINAECRKCGECAKFGNDCTAGDIDGAEDNRACDKFVSREVAELRECLQEAINNECNYCRTVRSDGTYGKCEHLRADGECDHLRGVKCIVHKWRKALEGAKDAS